MCMTYRGLKAIRGLHLGLLESKIPVSEKKKGKIGEVVDGMISPQEKY